jgi:drug/metabolite transporter (DMT)-like permease
MAGLDVELTPGFVAGVALGGGSANTFAGNGAAALGSAFQAMLYGEYAMGSLFFGGQVAYLNFDQTTTRSLGAWNSVSRDSVVWPDQKGWVLVVYAAIFASLIAQILYIKGVEQIGANRAGLFINLVPVFGTLLSVVVLSETLHTYQIAALIMALAGIAVAERKKSPAS